MNDQAKDPLFGADTEAALESDVSGETMPTALIAALAHVKAAMASVNATRPAATGVEEEMAEAIIAAADEVVAGRWDDEFPVDVFQTGSGTSTNMNMNEVLATLASRRLDRPVHANDHVNAAQSTNDTFPTAIRIAALIGVEELVTVLRRLERELGIVAVRTDKIVKAARTHLMDATPVMLGHEIAGHRFQVREAVARLESVVPRLSAVPLGGTATGNGLNAPPGHAARAVAALNERTGLELTEARDHFAVQGAQDSLVELSAQLRGVAVTLFKIANDLRWLASGPRNGLGEIRLPELQPGSSIMPGKVNPVICEIVLQVAAEVIGNDATIAFAGTQGNLELNTFLPVIGRNLLASLTLLSGATALFADRCVVRIEVDVERCRRNAEATPAIATALNPFIGYEAAAEVVRESDRSGRSIRDVVVEDGHLDAETADRVLDVVAMAEGTVAREELPLPGEDPRVPPSLLPPGETGILGPGI